MTPLTQSQKDALRDRVAVRSGWQQVGSPTYGYSKGTRNVWAADLPDFTGSLDAMHEAEKTLTRATWWTYGSNLRNVITAGGTIRVGWTDTLFASAEQRAIAFVLTHDEKLPWEDAR